MAYWQERPSGSITCAASQDLPKVSDLTTALKSNAVMLYICDWTVTNREFMDLESLQPNAIFFIGAVLELRMYITLITEHDRLMIKLEKTALSAVCYASQKKEIYIHLLNSKSEEIENFSLSVEYPFIDVYEKYIDASAFTNEDSLNVRIFASVRNVDISTQINEVEQFDTLNLFRQDMSRVFNDRKTSADVKVLVQGQEFLAHKIILSSQSSYFSEAFKQKKVLQSVDPEIIELDEDSSLFRCVLTYIYTGEIVNPKPKSYFDLYEFSKKYEISNLTAAFKLLKYRVYSELDFELLTCEWTVDLHEPIDRPMYSPTFQCTFDSSIKWRLKLDQYNNNSARVRLGCSAPRPVAAIFQISDPKDDTSEHEYREFSYIYQNNYTLWPRRSDPNAVFNLDLTDNYFCMHCVIRVSKGVLRNKLQNASVSGEGNLDLRLWSSNFSKHLDDKHFSDVCLQVGEETFDAHKVILSARSSVFRGMFEAQMAESLNGIVKIEDISSLTMSFLLKYIYTGEISDLEVESAANIFRAADKYDLLCLKNKCLEMMKKNINSTNACKFFILGNEYGDTELKNLSFDYISNNKSSLKTPEALVMVKMNLVAFGAVSSPDSNASCSSVEQPCKRAKNDEMH